MIKNFPEKIKLLAFDLDGTLAESKQEIKKDLAKILKTLIKKYLILIIGGGKLSQIKKQIGELAKEKNLIIGALSGSLVFYKKRVLFKTKVIPKNKFKKIKEIILNEFKNFKFKPKKIWGKLIDFRKNQITISFLGQKAPLKEKKKFKNLDEKLKIRENFLKLIKSKLIKKDLKNLNFRLGGLTSIDINLKGVDKAYCLKKVMNFFKLKKSQIIFFGNELFPMGNDFPIKKAGFKIVEVLNPKETKKKLIIIFNIHEDN